MRQTKIRAALIFFFLLGCEKDPFQARIEASRAQQVNRVAAIGPGLPFFVRQTMDPVWSAAATEKLARVEKLALVDHEKIKRDETLFRGSPAFVVFFFSKCPGLCPMVVANLQRIETQIGKKTGFRFLAISVDPANDSPETLADYARKMNVDGRADWRFLTGAVAEIARLQQEVFSVEFSRKEDGRIVHSERVFAVDGEGYVRAVLNATELAMPLEAKKVAASLLGN